MAENKKSFVLYSDLVFVLRKLVLKDRENNTNYSGELFLHILEFVNGNDLTPIDFIVEMALEPIKAQLKRDLQTYEKAIETKSNSGAIGNLKRWHSDLYQNFLDKKITLEKAVEIAKSRTAIKEVAKVADNDNVNDTDNVNDILLEKETKNKFIKPNVLEIKKFINEKNLKIDAENFYFFYESKNWMVGKNKMTDWKKAIMGWNIRNQNNNFNETNTNTKPKAYNPLRDASPGSY